MIGSAVLLCIPLLGLADNHDAEAWFNDDSEQRALAVNEGELEFLGTPPNKKVHHHHNILTVSERSMRNGWVKLEQCHRHLDRVHAAQVTFKPGLTRKLKVVSFRNIEKAWVEGDTVQLLNIGDDAELCISADSRAFTYNPDGSYSLRNGPYMRRFLDGYYPMHVTIEVRLTTDRLQYIGSKPVSQPGFQVIEKERSLLVDTWFEGQLRTEFIFQPR
jgi:hypothetical protein